MIKINFSTIPNAIEELFGVHLKEHEKFRNSVYTLVKRNGFFELNKEEIISGEQKPRHRISINRNNFIKLNNAILLQAFFPNPKDIEKIFINIGERNHLASWGKDVFINHQSVLGIGLINQNLHSFFEILETDEDLEKNKLPNPFKFLPQISLKGISSLVEVLAGQASSLSLEDSMMANFLNGDIEAAAEYAINIKSEQPIILQYKHMILQKYEEAVAFDNILEEWRD